MRNHTSITVRSAAAASAIVAALALTAGTANAEPASPTSSASCVATITVPETRIAPGFVGQEAKVISHLGPRALASVVTQLAPNHLGGFEGCAALIGE
ncbi:MAG: hypothetical protein ACRD1K_09050 [Acidimicrobiales bacterium]